MPEEFKIKRDESTGGFKLPPSGNIWSCKPCSDNFDCGPTYGACFPIQNDCYQIVQVWKCQDYGILRINDPFNTGCCVKDSTYTQGCGTWNESTSSCLANNFIEDIIP